MTNKEYIELKKREYCDLVGIDSIDSCEDEDVKMEWFARLNQIRSGQLMGLSSADIDKFITLEGYVRREFVKSCVYERISEDILEKIINCDDTSEMLKVKKEYYRSDYIVKNIDNKMSTIRGAVDDCEQKFIVFEKYLDNFSNQIENKDKEILELKETVSELQDKLLKSAEEMANIKIQAVESASAPEQKNIVVTRVIENPDRNKNEDDVDANTKKRGKFGTFLAKTSSKASSEQQYIKEKVNLTITDLASYIISAKLTSEQLLEISKAITMEVSDEQIVMMIENGMSPMQIRNLVNVIIAKRNAEKKKRLSEGVVSNTPEKSLPEASSISDMISDMEEIDEEYIEEMEDIYE